MARLVHRIYPIIAVVVFSLSAPAAAQENEAAALNAKVLELYRAGKFTEAIPLARRALAMREKAAGPDRLDLATALNNLAELYRVQGNYAEAETLNKRSLAIREKAFGPRHPALAPTLNNLASLYLNQGRYADAESFYARTLAILEGSRGSSPREVAASLDNLASLYWRQGRYADSESLRKRALEIREKALGPDHPDVGQSLNNLAVSYHHQGRLAEAEPLYKRSQAVWMKALPPNHPDIARSLNNLAALYKEQGRYADAAPLYERSRVIFERMLGPDHPEVAHLLSNLAAFYEDQGRYADAEPLYKQSLAIREKALGPDHPDVAQALNNMAIFYANQGRYIDAEPLYKKSLAAREKALGPDHPDVAIALNNLAVLYGTQGRYAAALPFAQRLIADRRVLPSIVLPILLGSYRSGLISTEKAIDDSLNVVQSASQTSAASAIGKLAVRLAAGDGRLAQLVRKDQDLAVEAQALDQAIIAAVSNEPSKRDAAAERRTRDRLAAVAAERAALQKTFAIEFPDYAALSNPLPLTARDIQAVLSADEALVLFSTSGSKESYVFALTRDRVDWQAIPLGADALSHKVAAFRRGLDLEQLAGANDAFFDLSLANELYAALLGPVEPLIKDKKQLLVVPSGALTALPFNLLVTEKPPAALPDAFDGYRDAAWLIKRQAVSVLPSVASLKALRAFARTDQGSKPMIGFGDPVFGPERPPPERCRSEVRAAMTRAYTDFWPGAGVDRAMLAQNLCRLADSADELKAVAQKLGAPLSDIKLRKDATETNVKRAQLADYRVVYFATHGLVAGDVKGFAEPSLALSLPEQPSDIDDGLLTASEVAQLKLNADWVVLSACNTIAGDKPGAEALSGLARSFFYAGARALLVSHWAVDSAAATRLTISTFDNLKSNPAIGRAEALRQAMLGYLNDTSNPVNAYPAFWGPFVLIGEGAGR
jgi:CHAT domain-containing protein/DNA-binding SARP family transcriptional activator